MLTDFFLHQHDNCLIAVTCVTCDVAPNFYPA
jgi:hypothetical protein